ncbi:thiamine ABC transporter ATP-binding protein [Pseudooceanicola sp.]|uniref:thiamine ABC transporter ATP-binding protein n=1 Tax=Pseudooceanicola sp. TaxID=1914328 RepID=UPI002606C757|nr:thiamine ABC transporter ATP-binding protein [Pseudooceanicola sp.]MDF1855403.1 thiamine ABC transporter ATP-binding protein [Pseudooceanicola sp.]
MLTLETLRLTQDDFTLSADWQVPTGGRVALIGPSGAGKSTLMAAIAGFLTPTSGRILWDGADITNVAPGKRPVAMLFQDGNLFPHLTLAQNVGLGIRPDLRLSAADKDRVQTALDRVGLEGMAARKPATLSGGQQSRAALARVLVQRRPLLLLDEPFASLGPALRVEMLDLVADLCRDTGATLILVSHTPDDARRIADSVVVVDQGATDAPVDTEAAFANPSAALSHYLG